MDDLLNKIRQSDIKGLADTCDYIRKRIIEVVSKNGGHLAPSLGVVELTVALHHVFESPKENFVWDVGHQAYAHKIITGRDATFDTLRQKNGVSGFPKISESEHDAFGAGHSSTSISAAFGIAEAKRKRGDKSKTIAVIGDGSLTGGLAYEGLNNAGHSGNKRLIVILNDNQMSIDKNVGAISRFMNKGITNPIYNKVKKDIKTLFGILSTNDINLVELTKRATLAVKDFFMAGSLFEAFGFRYIGPINGHDLEELVETFKNISSSIDDDEENASPVLLHVITKKGKGYAPAEEDPSSFHGVSAFCPTIKKIDSDGSKYIPTYTEVFGTTICKMMGEDEKIIAITAAMPSGTGLDHIKHVYPNKYYDVGIAEPHAVVFAAGLASKGYKPVVAIYSTFLQRAHDQIVHDVCLQNLPVVFAIDRAGVVGEDGATHHGVFDLSYLRHIPNLIIMSPKNESEFVSMLKFAFDSNKPCAIRYPRGKGVGVSIDEIENNIQLGKMESIIEHQSARYSIFAIGNMVENARKASEILSSKNIISSVINVRFEKPLDETAIINEAKKGRTIVTIEDNALAGGFGSAVLEVLSNNNLNGTNVIRFGYPDEFVEHAKISELHDKYDLTPEKIAQKIGSINR